MSWIANQIYAVPSEPVIEALKPIAFLRKRMFHITDLEGIRFEWVRERFFADEPREDFCHDLPPEGVLAIAPHLYEDGYAQSGPPPETFRPRRAVRRVSLRTSFNAIPRNHLPKSRFSTITFNLHSSNLSRFGNFTYEIICVR